MKKLKLDELNRISTEEFKTIEKNKFVIVLDSIRSLNNVGSVFRTSDAFLVEKIYLCGITGTPPHRDIEKTALGATETVSWEHKPDIKETVLKLKNEGFAICAIEQAQGSVMLHNFEVDTAKKYALVFGNEVFGVSEEVMQLCDYCIEIPQFGTKHSLNISVSAGIVIWEFAKKLNQ
jgi:23S rRNA (guanosine2251-2'-O)-methyltransferase